MNNKIMKQVSENEDSAIKLLKENVELKERINKALELLNQEWYSVLRKETITKVKEILDKVEEK